MSWVYGALASLPSFLVVVVIVIYLSKKRNSGVRTVFGLVIPFLIISPLFINDLAQSLGIRFRVQMTPVIVAMAVGTIFLLLFIAIISHRKRAG